MASNKKGEGLVEKNTQHLPTESNTSLPSSALTNRSDVTSSICFNSASTESLDGDIKVYPGSTSDDDSRSLTKNAKSPTHSTSGSENTSIGLDNANKVRIHAVILTDRIVTFSVHMITFILPLMKAVGGPCKIACICS